VIIIITRETRVILFSVVSVCVFVCLSVWMYVHIITPEQLEIEKFSGHYPTAERAGKFENGYIGVRWW